MLSLPKKEKNKLYNKKQLKKFSDSLVMLKGLRISPKTS